MSKLTCPNCGNTCEFTVDGFTSLLIDQDGDGKQDIAPYSGGECTVDPDSDHTCMSCLYTAKKEEFTA